MAVLLDLSDSIVHSDSNRLVLRSQLEQTVEDDDTLRFVHTLPLHRHIGCNLFAVEYYGSSFRNDSPAVVQRSEETGDYTIHGGGRA